MPWHLLGVLCASKPSVNAYPESTVLDIVTNSCTDANGTVLSQIRAREQTSHILPHLPLQPYLHWCALGSFTILITFEWYSVLLNRIEVISGICRLYNKSDCSICARSLRVVNHVGQILDKSLQNLEEQLETRDKLTVNLKKARKARWKSEKLVGKPGKLGDNSKLG